MRIFKYLFLVMLLDRPAQCALPYSVFNEVTVQGLEVYGTMARAVSPVKCAYECWRRRREVMPYCEAFTYHPVNRTCEFYSTGISPMNGLGQPVLHVFMYHVTDMFHRITVGNRQFSILVSSMKRKFADARAHCNALGGYLIQVDSVEELEALSMVVADQRHSILYVGATDIAKEGEWVTDRDGTPLNFDVMSWGVNAPDNFKAIEHCGCILKDSPNYLLDVSCTRAFSFICEQDV